MIVIFYLIRQYIVHTKWLELRCDNVKKVNLFIGTLSTGGAERVVSNLSLNLSNNIEKNVILFGKNLK